jgi:ATP-dependent DNA helicase RecQ
MLEYFDEPAAACGNCDTCLDPVEAVDRTHEARLALSAIFRCGESFGTRHIIDVLMGRPTDKVRRRRHDQLRVFGMGGALDERQWQGILRQLVALGLARVDLENHSVLRLGQRDRVQPVLREETQVMLRQEPEKPSRPRSGRKESQKEGAGVASVLVPLDRALFAALRTKRLEIAQAQNLPAYVVFNDRTLVELARERPGTLEAMSRIPGIGEVKLKRYGATFLGIIAEAG